MGLNLCINYSCNWCYADANGADSATFKIINAKLHVPVATLSTEDNAKLAKQLSEGLKDLLIGTNIR